MIFVKKISVVFLLALTSLSAFASGPDETYTASVSMFNRLKTGKDLLNFVFAFDKKTATEDKKYIENLMYSIGMEKPLTAKYSNNSFYLDGNKIKIDVLNSALGEYSVNGTLITLSPNRPLKLMFKQIEAAISPKYSKYEYFFMSRAEAAGPIAIAAASVYGLGAVVTGGGCAVLGVGFGGTSKETLTKIGTTCSKTALAWPYYAWKLYDATINGDDITEGVCEKSGPKNKFGDMVRLKLNNIMHAEILLKADAKSKTFGVYNDGYDPKNETYDQIHEADPKYNWLYIGDDKDKAIAFIDKLQQACTSGGTAALNKLIQSDKSIKKGLTELSKKAGEARRLAEISSFDYSTTTSPPEKTNRSGANQ